MGNFTDFWDKMSIRCESAVEQEQGVQGIHGKRYWDVESHLVQLKMSGTI